MRVSLPTTAESPAVPSKEELTARGYMNVRALCIQCFDFDLSFLQSGFAPMKALLNRPCMAFFHHLQARHPRSAAHLREPHPRSADFPICCIAGFLTCGASPAPDASQFQ